MNINLCIMDINNILCFDMWLSIAEIDLASFAAVRSINRQIRDYTNNNITKYKRKFLNEVEVVENGITMHYWTLPSGIKHGSYDDWTFDCMNKKCWTRCNYRHGKLHGIYQEGMNDMIFEEYHYIEGKKDGPVKYWNDNQTINLEGSYANDKHEGLFREWDDKGILIAQYAYLDGKSEGIIQEWYSDNGNLRREFYCCKGKNEGTYKRYNEDGKLIKEFLYKDGTKIE